MIKFEQIAAKAALLRPYRHGQYITFGFAGPSPRMPGIGK
jgi:hypothetical protein